MSETISETTSQPAATRQQANRRLPVWVIILAFALLAGFLTMIALGLKRAQQGPIIVGQTVPPIDLTLFDQGSVKTTDYAGKVLVLNFWASWCKPCEQEAAELEQAWKEYQPGEDVVFIGIDYVDTEPEARAYLQKFGVTYPNGPDLGTRASQAFRIRGVPETYIIDRQGKLAFAQIGPFQSLEEIKARIDPLLK
ncbi:MAG TPA: TlpA disulfide reductase family protein [Anaerolineaceae bacterium]|nr:TlpA disulfide reductase family protein [Anaerolineaceae bacterium]